MLILFCADISIVSMNSSVDNVRCSDFICQAIIDDGGKQLSTIQPEDLIGMIKNAEKSKTIYKIT